MHAWLVLSSSVRRDNRVWRAPGQRDQRSGAAIDSLAGALPGGRHALVDTDGRCLETQVQPASVQDGDGVPSVLKAFQARFAFTQRVFADGIYAGEKVATSIVVEIVSKPADQVGFQILPRRWVVERCFAWINRNRRLAKDFEATSTSATAFLYAGCVVPLTGGWVVRFGLLDELHAIASPFRLTINNGEANRRPEITVLGSCHRCRTEPSFPLWPGACPDQITEVVSP
jgi:transposase